MNVAGQPTDWIAVAACITMLAFVLFVSLLLIARASRPSGRRPRRTAGAYGGDFSSGFVAGSAGDGWSYDNNRPSEPWFASDDAGSAGSVSDAASPEIWGGGSDSGGGWGGGSDSGGGWGGGSDSGGGWGGDSGSDSGGGDGGGGGD